MVLLRSCFNWPDRGTKTDWWQELAERVRGYPEGDQRSWGIPFRMGTGRERRVILVRKGSDEVTIPLRGKADYICVLHEWRQLPEDVRQEEPLEGLVVAQYELTGSSGTRHVLPVRGRFEVPMVESPGPPWLAMPFHMWQAVDFTNHPPEIAWGRAQYGVSAAGGLPFVCALPNPEPDGSVRSVTIRGLRASPLLGACRRNLPLAGGYNGGT